MFDIVVHVPNRYLWEAVEKHEVEVRGKRWNGGENRLDRWSEYKECSYINVESMNLLYGDINGSGLNNTIITVDEYFKRYGDSPIMIGDYQVKNIDSNGFNVGCQRVTWETFYKIAAKRPKGE